MGHDISLYTDFDFTNRIEGCFPVMPEGNHDGKIIDDKFIPNPCQDSIYITYNLSKIYYKACKEINLEVDSFGEFLHGKKAIDLILDLTKLVAEIELNPDKYKHLEPSNGWGSYQSLIISLKALAYACVCYPNAYVYDWY